MKYHGYTLEPSYAAGSGFRIDKHGRIQPCKPTIEYWEAWDDSEKPRKRVAVEPKLADLKSEIKRIERIGA